MKEEFKTLSWLVKCYDCNADKIEDYDILKYREEFIKKLKKKCETKEEFSKKICREMMWSYRSKAEYELIVKLTGDGHVVLLPWCGCLDPEGAAIDVTEDTSFDWKGFAIEHIGKQIYRNEAKIDVYDQLEYRWDDFINYLWYTRLKWERKDSKFDKQ